MTEIKTKMNTDQSQQTQKNTTNQSELKANTCTYRQTRENVCASVCVCDLLRKWREFFCPITERRKAKPKQKRIAFETIENCS